MVHYPLEGQAGTSEAPSNQGALSAAEIEKILREEIDLAKPDDLAFLEFQAPHIARRIALHLGLLRDHE